MTTPLKLVLVLASVPLLALGGEGLYYATRTRQQVAVTCDQFVRQRPRASWVRINGCAVDYVAPALREDRGRIVELYFAVRAPSQSRLAEVALVAATSDPQVLDIAQNAIAGGSQADQDAFLVAMLRIVSVLQISRDVEGTIREGFLQRLQTQRMLSSFGTPLADDYAVLDLHARPSLVVPAIESAAGLLLLAAALFSGPRRAPVGAADADVTGAPAAVGSGPPVPLESALAVESAGGSAPSTAAVLERRLPRMMLVNLEPSAEAGEIEYAPPLGTRDEVRARIAAVLGELRAITDSRYAIEGPEWLLEIDLGADDPVWTVTIDARGSPAAAGELTRLAAGTGWRIFVPRLGTFVDATSLAALDTPAAGDRL